MEGRAERVRKGDRGMEGRACRGKKPGSEREGERLGLMDILAILKVHVGTPIVIILRHISFVTS